MACQAADEKSTLGLQAPRRVLGSTTSSSACCGARQRLLPSPGRECPSRPRLCAPRWPRRPPRPHRPKLRETNRRPSQTATSRTRPQPREMGLRSRKEELRTTASRWRPRTRGEVWRLTELMSWRPPPQKPRLPRKSLRTSGARLSGLKPQSLAPPVLRDFRGNSPRWKWSAQLPPFWRGLMNVARRLLRPRRWNCAGSVSLGAPAAGMKQPLLPGPSTDNANARPP